MLMPCQLKLPPRLAETLAEATVLFHCAILVAPGTTPPTQLPATFKFVVLFALLICAWAMLAELKIAAQAAASATRFMRVREDARRGSMVSTPSMADRASFLRTERAMETHGVMTL